MDLASDVALIARTSQRHVAIGTLRRFRRIIKRPRSLSGYAAGLPVVILVKATNPTVVIDWNVEMHLVATGAEFRRLVTHERLQKHATVRFGIQSHQKIVQDSPYRTLGRS